MDPIALAIFEALLFFVLLAVTFKAVMEIEIAKHFRKGAIWQIQLFTIFLSIGLGYLVLAAVMNLIHITLELFG